MKLDSALIKTFTMVQDKARLKNPFFVYCILCDLCHNSYADMAQVKQFYAILQKLNIIKLIIESGGAENIKYVQALYQNVSDICSKGEYDYYVSKIVEAYENFGTSYVTCIETVPYSFEERAVDLFESTLAPKNKRKGNRKKSQKLPDYIEKLRKRFIGVCIEHVSQMSVFSLIRRRKAIKLKYEYLVKLGKAKTKTEADDLYRSGIVELSQV